MPHILQQKPGGETAVYVWFSGMHTRIDMFFESENHTAGQLLEIADRIKALINRIEVAGNCFDSGSELYKINRLAPGVKAGLSDCLFDMLSQCLEYNANTGGLFDITVGSEKHDAGTIKKLHITSDRLFYRDDELVTVNLSGFIKGYALDQIKPIIETERITHALINIGNSSIMAIGCKIPGTDIEDSVLTTSGNDSPERIHIINPLTGEYIRGKSSVEVVTAGGAEGEVKATCKFITNNNRNCSNSSD